VRVNERNALHRELVDVLAVVNADYFRLIVELRVASVKFDLATLLDQNLNLTMNPKFGFEINDSGVGVVGSAEVTYSNRSDRNASVDLVALALKIVH
jgi:hypothetical protein